MENRYASLSGVIVTFGIVVFLLLLGIKFLNISYPITVTNKPVSELSVVGEGKVDVVPDTASVSVGVTSTGTTVKAMQQNINEVNNKIVAAMAGLGIDKKDIATSNYSVNPTYDYTNGQTPNGYNGSATLSIKVKDTAKLPDVVSAATAAGANQIYGTNYTIENPDKYREEARNEAIANAKSQAEKLASQLGIKLGRITNIIESTSGTGGPQPLMYKEASRDSLSVAPAPELQPGSQTVTSTVTLFFEKN